jgi:hypothetical protein
MKAAILLLAASVLTLGCAPDLWLRTAPPPTANETRVLPGLVELTEGVGLGFSVDCIFINCGEIRVETDAPGIARPYLAHLDRRNMGWTSRTRPGVVIVGGTPGVTTVRVWNDAYVRSIRVTVLPATKAGTPAQAPLPAPPSGVVAP